MQKQARNTSDLKRKKDGPAAAMLSTGVSVRLAPGFTDPAKQEDETMSVWYYCTGLLKRTWSKVAVKHWIVIA